MKHCISDVEEEKCKTNPKDLTIQSQRIYVMKLSHAHTYTHISGCVRQSLIHMNLSDSVSQGESVEIRNHSVYFYKKEALIKGIGCFKITGKSKGTGSSLGLQR